MLASFLKLLYDWNKLEIVTHVKLPWSGAALEEGLVTGTGVRPGNRNNIQLESISIVTMHEKFHFLHEEFTFLPYTTFIPVILPWIGPALEDGLVTGTGVRPGNRNNI